MKNFNNKFNRKFAQYYRKECAKALANLDIKKIFCFADQIAMTIKKRGYIYIFGNGGSASIAAHFAHNLNRDVSANLKDSQKAKAIALNELVSHFTGIANDRHYDQVFIAQLKNLLEPDDLVIGISASGNSENVIRAIQYAKKRKVNFVTLTGNKGGKLIHHGQLNITIDTRDQQVTEDIIQLICHMIVRLVHYHMENISDLSFPDIARLREKDNYLKTRKIGGEK